MKELVTDEILYQTVFDTSLAGFFVVDADSFILKANPAGEQMLGYGIGELLNKKIDIIFSEGYKKEYKTRIKKAASESVQILGLRKDKSEFPMDIRIAATVIEGQTIASVYCKPSDISVFESDRKLRTLVDNVSGILYRCKNDRDGTMEYISGGCERILGYSPQEFLEGKMHLSYITFQEDQDQVWENTQEALHKKEPFNLSYRIRGKRGNTKYMRELGRGVFDANGNLLAIEGFITDITLQKEVELALRANEAKNNALLEAIPDMMVIQDLSGDIIDFYAPEQAGLQVTRTEIIGRNIKEVVPPAMANAILKTHNQAIRTNNIQIREYSLDRNKRKCVYESRTVRMNDHRLLTIVRDITEKKKTEEELLASEEKNRAILEVLPDLITVHDIRGTIREIHVPDESQLIAPKEGLEVKNISEMLAKEVGEALKKNFAKVLRTRQMEILEVTAPLANGTVDYECRFVPLGNDRVLTIARNISETKAIQDILHLRNRALEVAGNGIIIVDAQHPDLPIIYSNNAFSRMTGYRQSETLGKNCRFLQNHDRDQDAIVIMAKAIQKGEACHVVLRNYRKDGTLFWNELNITPLYDEEQKLTHFIGVQSDVTEIQNTKMQLETYAEKLETKVIERTKEIEATVQKLVETNLNLEDQILVNKLAENKAQKSQEQFIAIAKNFPKGLIVVFNTDFELVYVEGKELTRVNLKKTDFEGKRIEEIPIFSKDQIERIKEDVIKTTKGESLSFEVEFQDNFYAVNSTPLHSDGDDLFWALFVYNNITEQKKVQEELAKALKVEQELNELKSRFISMASHEFRTPLSAILSSAILIGKQNEPGKEERREKHVGRIRTHVKQLVVILNDFLSLSKLEEGKVQAKPQHFELSEFCELIVDEMEATKKEGQTIQLIHTGVEIPVFLDPKLLSHVLINLLSNALKYSDVGQQIIFELKKAEESLIFKITDTGIGIPKQEQQHLFERFFRADNATNIQGTGIGLHIVKQYVGLMRGSVSFTSKMGKGSTFTVEFPLNLNADEKSIIN